MSGYTDSPISVKFIQEFSEISPILIIFLVNYYAYYFLQIYKSGTSFKGFLNITFSGYPDFLNLRKGYLNFSEISQVLIIFWLR